MSVMKWILNLGNEGKCDALNEQTPCLTRNNHRSIFLSNTLVSGCQRMLFHFWYFCISLLLLQNKCCRLSGLHSFNCQTYLSSAGLDRNVSHSEAAPVEDGSSPRKFEYISFKGPVCHPSDSLLCKVPSNLLLPGPFSLQLKYVFLASHIDFSNFLCFNVSYTNTSTSHNFHLIGISHFQ